MTRHNMTRHSTTRFDRSRHTTTNHDTTPQLLRDMMLRILQCTTLDSCWPGTLPNALVRSLFWLQASQHMWRSSHFHPQFAYWAAVIEDMVVDDVSFLVKVVEAVRVLFASLGQLEKGYHCTASQESMAQCVWHCQRYALYQSEENYARLRSSWADLGVRDRRSLRRVVLLSESARNIALLEVTGMNVLEPWPSLILPDLSAMSSTNISRTPGVRRRMSL